MKTPYLGFRRTFSLDEVYIIVANYRRKNSLAISARILQINEQCLANAERHRGLYRGIHGLAGRKQSPELIAKRVKNWGRKRKLDGIKDVSLDTGS